MSQRAWLTPDEAADQLQVSADTVRRWIRQGRLPATKVNGYRLRILPADLDRMERPAGEVKAA